MIERPGGVPLQDVRWTEADLASVVREARERFGLPAVAAAAMSSSPVHAQVVHGVRIFGRAERATLDDYFHIGSCSKSVLAVMVAKLVEQGKIGWQTRFFDVLPELAANSDARYRGITLSDLLLCEAGIQAYTDGKAEPLPEYEASVADHRLEFVKHLVAQPPASDELGRKFRHLYSNASYTMASAMLERASGLTYEDLVRETLTDDLGFAVHIGWPNILGADQPWGHLMTKGKVVEVFGPDHAYRLPGGSSGCDPRASMWWSR